MSSVAAPDAVSRVLFETPASHAQQAMWLAEAERPGSGLFHRIRVVALKGKLDAWRLRDAVDRLVARHQTLRTTFAYQTGGLVQRIHEALPVPLPRLDIARLPASQRRFHIDRIARELARSSLDPELGPLARALLIRESDLEHSLVIVTHHLVTDAGSDQVLVRHLIDAYRGDHGELHRQRQYAAFCEAERARLEGGSLRGIVEYWSRRLEGVSGSVGVPTDRAAPRVRDAAGGYLEFTVSPWTSAALRTCARASQCTPFTLFLSALALVVAASRRDPDVMIAVPVSTRGPAELDSVGLFVNVLPLRVSVPSFGPFATLLGEVRRRLSEARAHCELPTDLLVRVLRESSGLHAPLPAVAFSFQGESSSRMTCGDLEIEHRKVHSGTAKTDLTLYVQPQGGVFRGALEYRSALFESETVERIAAELCAVLDRIAETPSVDVRELRNQITWHESLAAPRRDAADGALTRNQMLVWMGQMLQPELPLYNICVMFRIATTVDPEVLRSAVQQVADSSDALRSRFVLQEGAPRRVWAERVDVGLELVDLSREGDPEQGLAAWVNERRRKPFFGGERLLQSALLRMGGDRNVWFLGAHHLLVDGWSIALIANRVSAAYGRRVRGEAASDDLPPAFLDVVVAERQRIASGREIATRQYWRRALSRTNEPLTFYGRSPIPGPARVERTRRVLGPERSSRVAELVGTWPARASLFEFFVAITAVWLHLVSGQRSLVVGAPFHNRRSAREKATIGLLMEMLPVRIELHPEQPLQVLMGAIRRSVREAMRHSRFSVGNSDQRKTYSVVVNFQPVSLVDFAGAPVEVDWLHAGYDGEVLTVQAHDFGRRGALCLDLDCRVDVFEESLRERAMQEFVRLVDAFCDDPSRRVGDPALLAGRQTLERIEALQRELAGAPEPNALSS